MTNDTPPEAPEPPSLTRMAETARFILDGNAGDLLEESAEELARQVLKLAVQLDPQPAPPPVDPEVS